MIVFDLKVPAHFIKEYVLLLIEGHIQFFII